METLIRRAEKKWPHQLCFLGSAADSLSFFCWTAVNWNFEPFLPLLRLHSPNSLTRGLPFCYSFISVLLSFPYSSSFCFPFTSFHIFLLLALPLSTIFSRSFFHFPCSPFFTVRQRPAKTGVRAASSLPPFARQMVTNLRLGSSAVTTHWMILMKGPSLHHSHARLVSRTAWRLCPFYHSALPFISPLVISLSSISLLFGLPLPLPLTFHPITKNYVRYFSLKFKQALPSSFLFLRPQSLN